jgi:Nitrous oxidase accessory protein
MALGAAAPAFADDPAGQHTVTQAPASSAHVYHVSCGAGAGAADGTADAPFTSLAQANAVTLAPGDRLLFERGSTCLGTLQPSGSGDASAPVTIGAYGTGAQPVIDGNGAHDAVLLQNLQHIVVQDLDITNAADPGSERNGLRLTLTDFGEGSGYLLQRLTIHDVRGGDTKALTGSSGIQVTVTGGAKPTWYDDLTIRDNTIRDVDREGIYFKSTWNKRPEVGGQDYTGLGPWTPSTRVVLSGNRLTSIAGDGIKLDTTQGAVIEDNTITGFQLRSSAANAGIWPFNADDTIVQRNDVSGGGNSKDGMSFDADGGAQRTVFQYNYSHDNKGGLLLLCPYSGAFTYGTIMRYNISHNDGERLFQLCPGDIEHTAIYNNTIVNDAVTPKSFLQDDNSVKRQISWQNNIVVNRGAAMTVADHGPVLTFDHNLFIGVGALPANADGTTNPGGSSAEPGLLDTATAPSGIDDLAGYALRAGSPALGSGAIIADNGGRDFFGNPVSSTIAPNLGAYQGRGIVDDVHPLEARLADARFLTGQSALVTGTLTWWGSAPSFGVTAQLTAPDGWRVDPVAVTVPGTLVRGQSVELTWRVTPPADARPGTVPLAMPVRWNARTVASATAVATVQQLYPGIEAAFDDVAITSDGARPYTGDLALSSSSLSADALKAAGGIQSGATVTGAHVTYSWPQFTPGKANAVWSNGQNIALSGRGAYLGVVLFGVNGSPSGPASVTYTDGSTSTFTLGGGDYYYNKPAAGNTAFSVMPYRNTPAGKDVRTVTVFESSVSIDPGKTVAYVTLPDLAPKTDGKTPGLLVLAMGVGG